MDVRRPSRIESGQYASVSDYVRDLIHRDQEKADERAALVAALSRGGSRRRGRRRRRCAGCTGRVCGRPRSLSGSGSAARRSIAC